MRIVTYDSTATSEQQQVAAVLLLFLLPCSLCSLSRPLFGYFPYHNSTCIRYSHRQHSPGNPGSYTFDHLLGRSESGVYYCSSFWGYMFWAGASPRRWGLAAPSDGVAGEESSQARRCCHAYSQPINISSRSCVFIESVLVRRNIQSRHTAHEGRRARYQLALNCSLLHVVNGARLR